MASSTCHHISTLLGLRWELRGREHLEKDRACIVVANHQSSLDVLGMFDLWPVMEKCTVVAKKEIFYAWPVGLAAWLCGLIYIDRMNSEKARSALNTATKEITDKKVKGGSRGNRVGSIWLSIILFIATLCRSSCGYFLRAPGTTPVRYTRSRRVPSTSRSGRSYPSYQSYSLLIISYPRKRRDLIPVSNRMRLQRKYDKYREILKIKKKFLEIRFLKCIGWRQLNLTLQVFNQDFICTLK